MARTKQTARCAVFNSAPRQQIKKAKKSSRKRGRSRSVSSDSQASIQLNTQQFSVKFEDQPDCQKRSIDYRVVECKGCGAFLNTHSQIVEPKMEQERKRSGQKKEIDDAQLQKKKASAQRTWNCEFCFTGNVVPDDYEIPSHQNPCYLVQKAPVQMGNNEVVIAQKTLIYCIDISGSMDTDVHGKSRLEAVQEAIGDEIKRMKFEKERVKIGLITFGSLVTLYCEKSQTTIPNMNYYNFENLVKICRQTEDIALPLELHFKDIKSNIDSLSTYGSTALGPALVSAIELASKGQKGNKIILCTDGMANVGLNGPDFYTKAANFAKEKGVMVNILSIKGDSCNLKELGKLTLSTGGSIMKIDPRLLGSQFNKITKEDVLGSSSHLKIVVSQLFEIENAPMHLLSSNKTILNEEYGNFTAQTELTFNFITLSKEQATKKGVHPELMTRTRAPMQVQLSYTNPNGSKYVQVIDDYRQLTQNKEDLFKEMNFGLFAASALQRISKMIKEERFDEAQQEIKNYHGVVDEVFIKKEKKEQLEKFGNRVSHLARIIKSKRNKLGGKKKMTKSKGGRGRGRARSRMAESQSEQEGSVLSSDSEEQVLYREMRARSRSKSP